MDFAFTPDQEHLRQDVRQFITENVNAEVQSEVEDAMDEGHGEAYMELRSKIAERGWIGISFPKEYGGQDAASTST